MPYFANFSGNPFWLPLNLSHSIFSAHIIDRQAYKSNDWIIDTSAIDHMAHSVSCLTTITSIINTFVYIPNGEKALVTHIGTVHISDNLILYGVLCVPSFTFNLISISQLTKSLFCCLVFLGSFCFIQDLANWNIIRLGKATKGLYLLHHRVPPPSVLVVSSRIFVSVPSVKFNSVQADLWHFRLGHPSYAKLSLLNNLVSVLPANKTICYDICHFSKQKRLSFPTSHHVSHCVFDLVHCDLWGAFSIPTIEGYKFFLTIIDDYSRCTWVYLLKSKSETSTLIQ